MGNRFASGQKAIAECDVCGFRYKLRQLKDVYVKEHNTHIKACPQCWDPDHPQLMLGKYPVDDPQAIRDPRPDNTYYQSGTQSDGSIGEGSRVIQWGWNPVGGAVAYDNELTPNALVMRGGLGSVVIAIS